MSDLEEEIKDILNLKIAGRHMVLTRNEILKQIMSAIEKYIKKS